MKSIVGFACCLFIIGCTTVRPTDTMKLGPPHMRLSPEEMSKFQECVTELGLTPPEINNSMEPSGPPMNHTCMLACHLQAKGMKFKSDETAICDGPGILGDKATCEACVAEAAGMEGECDYAVRFSSCLWRQFHGIHRIKMSTFSPE